VKCRFEIENSKIMANATNDDCRCSFMVPRKKRRCRMTVKAGNLYCGEHIHLLAKDSNEDQPQSDDVNRIPCPLDSKHSCSATKLKSHLLKCPSKAQASVEYISCSVNVPDRSKGITAAAGLTVASASDDQLMDVISKVNAIYVKEVEKCISSEILNHPLIDEEINLPHVGPAASKHLVQNSSLLAHLNANGALTVRLIYIFHNSPQQLIKRACFL
jgi:tRNA:m4X modification enzyme